MTGRTLVTDVLLGTTVVSCWAGVVGMLRMREPMQALHYVALPASVGAVVLTGAVLCETGLSSTTCKMALIALVLFGINSVVAHATARAFRTRELGHWEPRDGDPMEFVPKEHARRESRP